MCVVRWRSLRRADHLSREVLPSVMCVSMYDRETSIMKSSWPSRGRCATEKIIHMKAVRFSRMSLNFYQNSRCHIPEHDQLHTYGGECLDSLMLIDTSTFDYCVSKSDVSIINRSDSRSGLLYRWYPPQSDDLSCTACAKCARESNQEVK